MGSRIAHSCESSKPQAIGTFLNPVKPTQRGDVDDAVGIPEMLRHQLHHIGAAREKIRARLMGTVRAVAGQAGGCGGNAGRLYVGEVDHRQPSRPAALRIAPTMLV